MGGRVAIVLLLLAACGFEGKPSGVIDAARPDGTIDPDGGSDDAAIDARLVDASPDAPLSSVCGDRAADCTAAGGTCSNGACVIDRSSTAKVTCPTGMPCQVICNQNDDCKLGVDCAGATTCAVDCSANNACQDFGVDCGSASTCNVLCDGNSACQHGPDGGSSVECRMASSCTVKCAPGNTSTCQDGIDGEMAATCTATCCQGTGCDAGDTPGCTFSSTCP